MDQVRDLVLPVSSRQTSSVLGGNGSPADGAPSRSTRSLPAPSTVSLVCPMAVPLRVHWKGVIRDVRLRQSRDRANRQIAQ